MTQTTYGSKTHKTVRIESDAGYCGRRERCNCGDVLAKMREDCVNWITAAPAVLVHDKECHTDAAVAAIQFALEDDDGLSFLRYWNTGDFDILRKEWPEAPEAVYIGADPLHPQTSLISIAAPAQRDNADLLLALRDIAPRLKAISVEAGKGHDTMLAGLLSTVASQANVALRCHELANILPSPAITRVQSVPDILFDGHAVLKALSWQALGRTSPDNVADVLDAVVRLMRNETPVPDTEAPANTAAAGRLKP